MSKRTKPFVASKGQDPGRNQSSRFQEACEAMRKNASRFVPSELSSDSSEEELDEMEVMKKTLSNYAEDDTQNLRKIRECLQDILTSGAVVCLICIESVKRNDKVWSCEDCYCLFHLHCIQKWAKDSMFHQSSSNDEKKKKAVIKWCCPKCRSEYEPEKKPSSYLCFCGKQENPSFSSWSIPHACGQTCDKKLKPECGHTCCLLCHPGPCPPCPKTVPVSCCCSKSAKVSRRCSHKEWLCGKPCGKSLPCKIHKCEEPCHSGECPPCKRESRQKCKCGSYSKLQSCHNAIWQCDKVCGRPLQCGNHVCDVVCHSGPCPECPDSGRRACPCGKKSVVLPCTEKVVPCGDTCSRLLECELHRCSERCHYGPCGKCLQMRVMKCKCGQREKSVPCCKEYLCDIKCKNRRDCGRHNCSKKCCLGNCPPCELPCGKTLNCGKHKCDSLCHSGPCYPCHEIAEVACSCGATKISVPCGRKKSAVPPRCSSDCKLPSDCHHQERHKHKCHFGSCPPCRLVCNKSFDCGHVCPARCHSAVLTKIDTKQKKEGPWDLMNSYKMELVCKPCPPCLVPVPVTCPGGHETHPLPCSQAVSTSCGQKCGRALLCGNHTCSLECHKVEEISDLVMKSKECEACSEPCERARNPGCVHPCKLPCHPGQCRTCTQHIKMKCHCQINTLYKVCHEWTSADTQKQGELLTCSNRCPKEISCGHRCILSCHPGDCSTQESCKKKVLLRCPCKRKKKEVQCFALINSDPRPSCDDECAAHKLSLKALEDEKLNKKVAEEKRQQEKELQEFLRKSEGKKKRKKKVSESSKESGLKIKMVLGASAVVACVLGCLVYLLYGRDLESESQVL